VMMTARYFQQILGFFFYHLLSRIVLSQTVINIGAVVPRLDTNGHVFIEGVEELAAIVMAIREINPKTDLLPNVTLTLSVKSDVDDVATAFRYIDYLTKSSFGGKGVRAVIGPYFENSAAVTAQYVSSNSVNLAEITYKASSADLGNNIIYPNIFRTSASVSLESQAITDLLNIYDWKNIILFNSADSYGTYLSNQFEIDFTGTILNKFSLWPGLSDYSSYIRAASATYGVKNIFVIMMSSSADAGLLLKQGYDLGFFHPGVQIIGSSTLASAKVWQYLPIESNVPFIMKGVLALNPTSDRHNNSVYNNFVKNWRSQPNTISSRDNNGNLHCISTRDDDGNYLYQDRMSPDLPYVCTGLNFTSYSKSGIEIFDSALDAYDATYALAYALNTIHSTGSTDFSAVNILNALLYNTSFQGASGYLKFKTVGLGSETYGVGDRIKGITYGVLNFDPSFYRSGDESNGGLGSAYRTLFVLSDGKQKPCDPTVIENCATDIVYNTADNSRPIDCRVIIEVQLSDTVRIVTWVICILCALFVFFCGFTVYLFHDHKLIKAAQPVMLGIVLFGILLGLLKVLVATIDVTDGVCVAGVWLGHLAYLLVFGTLILKTWRVNKVVNSGMKKVRITQEKMNQIMAGFIFTFCVLLAIYTAVANPHQGYEDQEEEKTIYRLIKCKVDVPELTQVLFAIEGLILLFAAKLSWASRDVPEAVNDSSYVSICKFLHSGPCPCLDG